MTHTSCRSESSNLSLIVLEDQNACSLLMIIWGITVNSCSQEAMSVNSCSRSNFYFWRDTLAETPWDRCLLSCRR